MDPPKIYLELCPPVRPEDIPAYYDSFVHLLNKIAAVSIASHPAKGQISGFERSSNLVAYLQNKAPKGLKILFHLTCNDVNKTNIRERYDQVIKLQVDHLLGITGDPYVTTVSKDGAYHPDLYFKNSGELIMALNDEEFTRNSQQQQHRLPEWAIAAYPGSKSPKDEASRSIEKIQSTKGSLIITQCLTRPEEFESYVGEVQKGDFKLSNLKIIPSVAIFDSLSSLERLFRLTKIREDQELVEKLSKLDDSKRREFALEYLVKLCQNLLTIKSIDSIVICAFDQFKMAKELIDALANG